jgi:hypothetical protein
MIFDLPKFAVTVPVRKKAQQKVSLNQIEATANDSA